MLTLLRRSRLFLRSNMSTVKSSFCSPGKAHTSFDSKAFECQSSGLMVAVPRLSSCSPSRCTYTARPCSLAPIFAAPVRVCALLRSAVARPYL
ncbi:hypothetical protein D3C72_1641010 [compost metagenome]